ncbi:MAG: signal peptidase II [Acidobacteria bacterium]|nr:signal peptidase II [Acidobacteriota bacterium]
MRTKIAFLLLAVALFGLDRWSKAAVVDGLELYSSHTVIPGLFDLVHARNTGIAFSLFADSGHWMREWMLPALTAGAIVFVLVLFWRYDGGARGRLALALVLAGAAGNLYDRLLYGYVTDFLDVYVGSWHWPAFNVADSCITVGALLLLLDSATSEKRSAAGKDPAREAAA